MTHHDFLLQFQKKNAFEKYLNYFNCLLFIGVGLFFIYKLHFTDWYLTRTAGNITPIWGIYLFSIFFIGLGFYGFWRIPRKYRFTYIGSNKSLEENELVINQIINDFDLKELERNEQYRHFRYVGRFSNLFDVYIFFDTSNFCLNVRQVNFRLNGGFIDFGTSKKVTDKIKSNITAYLEGS